jgi:hypothetical protein
VRSTRVGCFRDVEAVPATGREPNEWLTLGRLVLLDRVGANAGPWDRREESGIFGGSRRRRETTMKLKLESDPIPHSSMSRALLAGSLTVVSVGCGHGHLGVISTAGTTYVYPQDVKAYADAARDSGAHDLHCPKEQTSGTSFGDGTIAADGCGQRAVYRCPPADSEPNMCQMMLISKVAK